MMLSLDTAYRSFGGEVEASNTPTICRLPDSRRHQLSAIAPIAAAAVLYVIASGKPRWVPDGFASNGYGDLSPGKYGLVSCFLSEVIATFFFLYVIVGTTSKGAAVGFAGLPIGLCLTLIHLFLIPVTNASVNPARSTGPALFAGGPYIAQLWLFWLAPIIGAAVAGMISRWQHDEPDTL